MKAFLKEQKIEGFYVVTDMHIVGEEIPNSKFSKKLDCYIDKTSGRSRPPVNDMICRFCKQEFGNVGRLRQHFQRTHWKESLFQLVRHNKRDPLRCRACTLVFGKQKDLRSHVLNWSHSIESCLDAGYEIWLHPHFKSKDETR